MNRVERERRRSRVRAAILFAIIGFAIVNLGVLALLQGHLHYQNYWGGWVFAPFAIAGGILVTIVAFRVGKHR